MKTALTSLWLHGQHLTLEGILSNLSFKTTEDKTFQQTNQIALMYLGIVLKACL